VKRREFLKKSSLSVIYSGVSLALLNTITSCGDSGGGTTTVNQTVPQEYNVLSFPDKIEPDELPYPTRGLNPDVAGDVAYLASKLKIDAGKDGGCMYGTFASIIFGLRDAFKDDPDKLKYYAYIPTYMAIYGKGGGQGWGTLCGACNGSALVTNLVAKLKDKGGLINKIIFFYTDNPMPATKLKTGGNFYKPSQYVLTGTPAKGEENRAKEVASWLSNAPSVVQNDVQKLLESGFVYSLTEDELKEPGDKELGIETVREILLNFDNYFKLPVPYTAICHASVNRFLEANDYKVTYKDKTVTLYPNSIFRIDRCSRLVGAMAKFTAMVLNTMYAPDAPSEWKISDWSVYLPDMVSTGVSKEASGCLSCHGDKSSMTLEGFPRTLKGKANSCTLCHGTNSNGQPRLYPQGHGFWDLQFKE